MHNPMDLIQLCKGHRIFLQTHDYPDPDAIASAYGLKELLARFDISSTICYSGTIEKVNTKRMLTLFDIDIVNAVNITDMTENDYIIAIDGQKYNSNFAELCGCEVACIDHHPTFTPCNYRFSEIEITGACASIIATYYKELNIRPGKNVATALIYGIKTDTSDFIRGGTSLDSDMFAYLYPKSDHDKITTLYQNVLCVGDLQAYATAIENIHIYDNCGFAMLDNNCPDALIATISDFILSIDVIEISIVYSVRNEGIKFSVRSELPQIDAGKLAYEVLRDYGGGGGHKSMAGGFITSRSIASLGDNYPQKLENMFLEQLKRMQK